MILSFINSKGGVGKTTSVVSTAAALAGQGRHVLLVDLDPHAAASRSLGLGREDLSPSIAEVLFEGLLIDDAIRETNVPHLHLAPGSMKLARADQMLRDAEGWESALRDVLEPIRNYPGAVVNAGRYDAILIDCPPSLSLVTVNCVVAADGVVIPAVPEHHSLEGLMDLIAAIEEIGDRFGGKPAILGILLTRVDHRRRMTAEHIALIRRRYGRPVFRAEIPEAVRVAEAPALGIPVTAHERRSRGAVAYLEFTRELLRRCKRHKLH